MLIVGSVIIMWKILLVLLFCMVLAALKLILKNLFFGIELESSNLFIYNSNCKYMHDKTHSLVSILRSIRLYKAWKKKLSVYTRMSVACFLMMKLHPQEMQCEYLQCCLVYFVLEVCVVCLCYHVWTDFTYYEGICSFFLSKIKRKKKKESVHPWDTIPENCNQVMKYTQSSLVTWHGYTGIGNILLGWTGE